MLLQVLKEGSRGNVRHGKHELGMTEVRTDEIEVQISKFVSGTGLLISKSSAVPDLCNDLLFGGGELVRSLAIMNILRFGSISIN
jgi:hypothetical protein